jgi:hydrogenase nickel incorporation protein HypB
MSERIEIGEDVLADDRAQADAIRRRLREAGCVAVNLMSSPGAGKTALLEKTAQLAGGRWRMAAVQGDVATDLDARRLHRLGIPAVQVTTSAFGGECHLSAGMVARALDSLDLRAADLLFIENVGNLICPAAFDLGENARVVLLSVTEGEEKPLKYPAIFQGLAAALISKIDLLPHLPVSLARLRETVRAVAPGVEVIALSAMSGEGMDAWLAWLERLVARPRGARA